MPKQKITKQFPTVDKFNKTFPKFEDFPDEEGSIIKFGDLEVNVVYHMYNKRTIKTKNGKAHIADFETEEEEKYTTWLPDSVLKKIEALKVKECWLWNGGKKENGDKSYFHTKVMKID